MRKLSLLVPLALAVGCSGGAGRPASDAGAPTGTETTMNDAGAALGCADLFDDATLRTYAIDISADEWAAMEREFNDLTALESGANFTVYHPVTFHLGSETATNAAIKLHGQSSWAQTVMFDGERAKMQFSVAAE